MKPPLSGMGGVCRSILGPGATTLDRQEQVRLMENLGYLVCSI